MSISFLPTTGSGGTQIPFNRSNKPRATQAMIHSQYDQIRLARYEEHWKFFQGLHWGFTRDGGEPLVTANYCRTIVNKKVSFLVGKGMTIKVAEPFTEITKPVLQEVWKYNKERALLLDMATTGSVTGDIFVLVTYQAPSEAKLRINPYTRGQIRIRLLGSEQVFPTYNPLNKEELLHVRIITEVDESMLTNPEALLRGNNPPNKIGGVKTRKWIEDIFPDRIIEGWEDTPRQVRPNDLGEIPLVHIVNESFPGEYYGISDLDGVIDLQREFNEKMTDVSDIVNYHAAPVTVITGAKAKNLEKGPKAIWAGLPSDAKVYNLESIGNLPASHQYLEFVRQVMMDISGLPEGSLGRIQAISNTSAAALQVAYQPLVEAIERKKPSFEHGIEAINYFILRFHQLVTGEAYPVDLCRHCGGRIVEVQSRTADGRTVPKRRCFMVDKQTLEFLHPEDVEISQRRTFSFGEKVQKVPMYQARAEYGKEAASYWDAAPEKDLQREAEEDQQRQLNVAATQNEEASSAASEGGKPANKPAPLAPTDINVPPEPELVRVVVQTWNPLTRSFEAEDLGEQLLVPTGCKRPDPLSPYETEVCLRSALPRDKERDSNLYAQWQNNGWISRHWAMEHLEEGINIPEIDRAIEEDMDLMQRLRGQVPAAGVAQTPGVQGSTGGVSTPMSPPKPSGAPTPSNQSGDNQPTQTGGE